MSSSGVTGPFWGGTHARHAGRYPLSVERHAISQVARLLPGVTTVTPHARYYTLHAVVADETQRQGLVAAEAQSLLRRAEVVLAGITLTHGSHPGMPAPHGGDAIRAAMTTGSLGVAALSQPGRYVQAQWGFLGPYLGSEGLLGLTHRTGSTIAPGSDIDLSAAHTAMAPVLALAREDVVSLESLASHPECCLCGCADAADGELLRHLLVPAQSDPQSNGGRRAATIRLLLRLMQQHELRSITREGSPILAYDPAFRDDPIAARLDITDAWRGLVLRNQSVTAWRDLWAELVNSIGGLTSISDLADTLADALPAGSVRSYLDALPAVGDGDSLLPAEVDPTLLDRGVLDRCLALLLIGGTRVGSLSARVAAYFEDPSELVQELSPTWVSGRINDWANRPTRDFARWLVEVLVARSQRIALLKATFSPKRGTFQVPTRVFVRDGFVFRDSREGGGGVSLRWDQLTTVLAGAGLCHLHQLNDGTAHQPDASVWRPTARGEALLA